MGNQVFKILFSLNFAALFLGGPAEAQLRFSKLVQLTYGQINNPAFKKNFVNSVSRLSLNRFVRQVSENYDFEKNFVAQGVPERAVKRTLDYFNKVRGNRYKVPANPGETHIARVGNQDFVIIIDYSKNSTEKRFYVLNMNSGEVEKYLVAHGLNSGGKNLYRTSNVQNSKQTSLGFYVTGDDYIGQNGLSLKLYGLEPSNNKAYTRTIIVHGASYVSPEFIQQYGRAGRSHGCITLEKPIALELIPRMKPGTLILAYHDSLSEKALVNPRYQSTLDNNPKKDNPPPTKSELNQKP